MITNFPEDPNQAPASDTPMQLPQELVLMSARSLADGTAAGIMMFIRNNRVNVKPGTKSEEPLKQFVLHLVAEFADGSSDPEQVKMAAEFPYPFKDSIKAQMTLALDQAKPTLFALWANNEVDNIQRICRIIGAGETVKFLDERRPEVLKFIDGLRGDDLANSKDGPVVL